MSPATNENCPDTFLLLVSDDYHMSVRTRSPATLPDPVRRFVGVLASAQTYRNLVYLALTFPLGVFYFVLLVTGFSIGYSLLFALVGVPILVGLFLLSDRLLVFERWLAVELLGTEVPVDRPDDHDDVWDYVRTPLGDLGTWVGLGYLVSKFALGVVTFVLLTLLGTIAGALILAPLSIYHDSATIEFSVPEPIHVTFSYAVQQWGGVEVISYPVVITSWEVTTLPEALVLSVLGVVLLLVSLHLCNVLAKLQGWYVRLVAKPRPLV